MVAKSNSTVLLRGETGCGKDVVARAIHESSKRNGELINTWSSMTKPDSNKIIKEIDKLI